MEPAQKRTEAEQQQPFAKGWNEMAKKVAARKTPKVEWTIQKVKAKLGDLADELSDSAFTVVLKSKNPDEKIGQIKKAFEEIKGR